MKTASDSLHNRDEALDICRVSRPHLAAYGVAGIVGKNAGDHPGEIGPMVLAVTALTGLSPFSFKVEGGGVEEDGVECAEEIPALRKQVFFNDVPGAPWREGCAIRLIVDLFPQKAIAR
jgi:hypothetical protein